MWFDQTGTARNIGQGHFHQRIIHLVGIRLVGVDGSDRGGDRVAQAFLPRRITEIMSRVAGRGESNRRDIHDRFSHGGAERLLMAFKTAPNNETPFRGFARLGGTHQANKSFWPFAACHFFEFPLI